MTEIRPGQRVRLRAPSPILTLLSPFGTVVEPDPEYGDLGYWLVQLDEPATYRHGDETVAVPVVRELAHNLSVEVRA